MEVSGDLWDKNGPARALTTETLTRLDDQGRLQPWLALQWNSQNRDRRWQFTIRPGVKFHDGTSLTAGSIAEALGENGCPGCPWRSVRAEGESVVFSSDAPMPLLPAQLALPDFGISKAGENGVPTGTGPMKATQAAPNSVTLTAFDSYWGGHAFLETVEIVSGRRLREQWLDLGVGRTDLAELPAEQIRKAQQDRLRSSIPRNNELIALAITGAVPALQDSRVRQAIAETVDRASLLNFIFQKQGEVSGSLLPNWLSGYAALIPSAQNIAHARELRSQAGPLPPMTIAYDPADPALQLVAERIALNARELGITLRPIASYKGDLQVMRRTVRSYDAAVALEDFAAALGLEPKTPDDAGIEGVFQREREIVASYRIVPLLYVPRGFVAGDRVHNWHLGDRGLPAFSELWTEARK